MYLCIYASIFLYMYIHTYIGLRICISMYRTILIYRVNPRPPARTHRSPLRGTIPEWSGLHLMIGVHTQAYTHPPTHLHTYLRIYTYVYMHIYLCIYLSIYSFIYFNL